LAVSSTRATERAAQVLLPALLAVSLCVVVPAVARAQTSPATSRADALFVQGKAALEAGDFSHACPKLQESYGIDPSNGTLLALALCHEGLGRTATAWRELKAAADGATKEGRADRADFARAHIAKLEPRLSTLAVVVPGDAPSGIAVDVDGAALAQADWGKPVPIDPGHHTVGARAPGRTAWTGAVDLGIERDAQTVKVGPLAPEGPAAALPGAPVAAAPPANAPPESAQIDAFPAAQDTTPGAWKRPAGWIAGGAGVVVLGIGAYFGASAISKSNDAKSQCTPSLCTNGAAVNENNDAKTAATISDVTIGVGLAAVAAGAYLLLTAPASPSAPAASRVTPVVGSRGAGLVFERSW
jgi:hypothetical protein